MKVSLLAPLYICVISWAFPKVDLARRLLPPRASPPCIKQIVKDCMIQLEHDEDLPQVPPFCGNGPGSMGPMPPAAPLPKPVDQLFFFWHDCMGYWGDWNGPPRVQEYSIWTTPYLYKTSPLYDICGRTKIKPEHFEKFNVFHDSWRKVDPHPTSGFDDRVPRLPVTLTVFDVINRGRPGYGVFCQIKQDVPASGSLVCNGREMSSCFQPSRSLHGELVEREAMVCQLDRWINVTLALIFPLME